MNRAFILVALIVPAVALSQTQPTTAREGGSGTAAEAKAMLEKAVEALKDNPAQALASFRNALGGFKDRDLYVFCVGPDGTWSAHPVLEGQQATEWSLPDGKVLAQEMLTRAQEDQVSEISYRWSRAGDKEPVRKVTFFIKVGDQVCGVGYYP